MNLRQRALSGVRWTAAENLFNVVSGIVFIAVLARLLQPQDFGLMAIAAVVLGFSQFFADMGISNGIIHRQDVSESQLSTLYWVNVAAGLVVFGVVVALAGPLATFYREPELASVIMVAALTLLVQPFGQQFGVLLQKELHFNLLARIGMASRFCGLVAAVLLAWSGAGVYSLVYSAVLTAALETALTVAFGRRIHRPRLHFRPAEVRHFFSFGAWQMGEAVINFFNANLDSLLIGRLAGTEALGLYSVARQLVMRPAEIVNPIVTRVSTPVMAKVQDDLARLRAIYLQTINHLSSLNFPIYAAIAVFAREITLLLFGEKWLAAVPLIQILAAYAAVRSTANPVGSLLLARGRVRRGFWWNVGLLVVLPAFIAVGATWGVAGVAWSLLAMQCLLLVPGWLLLVRPLCGASFPQYHAQLIVPALAAAAAALAGFLAASAVPGTIPRLAAGLAAGAAVTLLIYRAWNRGFLQALAAMVRRG